MLYVLVASSDEVFWWVDKDDTNGVPIGGVTRDCSPEGRRIYVIRAYYIDKGIFIAGNYEESNEYVEFERRGVQSSMAWEFLVSNKDVAGKKNRIQITQSIEVAVWISSLSDT